MKVVVIGGGPAGMLAAISAKKQGNDVTLLEKMDKLGRKLHFNLYTTNCNKWSKFKTKGGFGNHSRRSLICIQKAEFNSAFLLRIIKKFFEINCFLLIIPTKSPIFTPAFA